MKTRVHPFKGSYFSKNAGNLSDLVAPPYDVIDDSHREELYAKSSYNIVRISKSKEISGETVENQYTYAANLWKQWQEKGIIQTDDSECFYFYQQEFTLGKENFKRLGLVCAHDLTEWREGVFPHEKTLSAPKEDRYRLLSKTKTHFGQIFGIYEDKENGKIEKFLQKIFLDSEFLGEAIDPEGVQHLLKRVKKQEDINLIQELFKGVEVVIADGHHRYETALGYSKEQGLSGISNDKPKRVMMSLVSTSNSGLTIFPTHRLIKNLPSSFEFKRFLKKIESDYKISSLLNEADFRSKLEELWKKEEKVLGLYAGENRFYLLSLENNQNFSETIDVILLHQFLERELGIDGEQLAKEECVEYVKDLGHSFHKITKLVDLQDKYKLAFFVKAPTLEETLNISLSGQVMPQKSTFFYPKLFTGPISYIF